MDLLYNSETFCILQRNKMFSIAAMNYSVVKIPVSPVSKKFYEKRYGSRMDARGYIQLDKNHAFGMKVIHYLDLWFESWEIPQVQGPMLKVSLPKFYMKYGIHQRKLLELKKILDNEAMEFLIHEIACAAQYPGISVTDAIITVMARYDISDEEYRTDSMRRHFDRYCADVLGESFKDFSHKINAAMKVLYERMVERKIKFEELAHV